MNSKVLSALLGLCVVLLFVVDHSEARFARSEFPDLTGNYTLTELRTSGDKKACNLFATEAKVNQNRNQFSIVPLVTGYNEADGITSTDGELYLEIRKTGELCNGQFDDNSIQIDCNSCQYLYEPSSALALVAPLLMIVLLLVLSF